MGITEWVAGGGVDAWRTGTYHNNYYNRYSSTITKPGDATMETSRWKGSTYEYSTSAQYPLGRALDGKPFSATHHSGNYFRGRACVICGIGF